MYELWTALEQAREYKWVELSHPLDNDSPYWAGIPDGSVELSKMVYDWGNPMLDCLIQTFKFPGQFGTHIDFPGHFLKGGLLSEAYGARQLVYPLCVVDVSEKVKEDVHYAVTVQDILDYEAKYGPIPDGAFVALRTDWGTGFHGAHHHVGIHRTTATRPSTPTPPSWPPKRATWPASGTCSPAASSRWSCCATWTR